MLYVKCVCCVGISFFWFIIAAGKKVTEDEVENMIESDNPAIFTQDVCYLSVLRLLFS